MMKNKTKTKHNNKTIIMNLKHKHKQTSWEEQSFSSHSVTTEKQQQSICLLSIHLSIIYYSSQLFIYPRQIQTAKQRGVGPQKDNLMNVKQTEAFFLNIFVYFLNESRPENPIKIKWQEKWSHLSILKYLVKDWSTLVTHQMHRGRVSHGKK